jgi:hypothetical protein
MFNIIAGDLKQITQPGESIRPTVGSRYSGKRCCAASIPFIENGKGWTFYGTTLKPSLEGAPVGEIKT